MAKFKGFFITFEGTEGAGKSTLLKKLEALLRTEHPALPVILTREPGGSEVAEKIRNLILHDEMNPWTELFLYEAARSEHLHQTILPALKSGKIVLCDRFTDSTLAYQGVARGLPWNTIKTLNQIATQKIKPHLTIWVDVNPETGLKRAQDPNRFEAEGLTFQKKVRQGYKRSQKENPKRWLVMRSDKMTPDELAQKVFKKIIEVCT